MNLKTKGRTIPQLVLCPKKHNYFALWDTERGEEQKVCDKCGQSPKTYSSLGTAKRLVERY